MRERRFIEVRKLAALDIAFRGRRWALFEFAFSVIFPGLLAVVFFAFAARRSPELAPLPSTSSFWA